MRSFADRSGEPELMDTEACDYATFRDCLVDLSRVNALTLAYQPTLRFLDRIATPEGAPLRILDVGSGHGDMLRRIDRWAARRGVAVDLVGVDLNPWAAQAARAATAADRPVRWLTMDAFAYDEPVDLVISSLFAHHLDDARLVRFLAWMEDRARLGWFVNDLRRAAFPYYGFGLLARAMRWHRFVRHDGPVSIARAFQPRDWIALVREAGLALETITIERRFPFRLCVARVKP